MLKRVNYKSLHDDLRKVGITFLIGALTGLFLGPHKEMLALICFAIIGSVIWYLGLSDGEIKND